MEMFFFISRVRLLAVTLFFFATSLHALTIDIQSGKEKGSTYSTIHLEHHHPFSCQSTFNEFGKNIEVKCYFKYAPRDNFSDVKNPFFIMTSYETAKEYILSIKPKKKMKLYPLPDKLFQKNFIVHKTYKESKHWFILGYEQELPLIKNKKIPLHGINFPINFFNKKLPSVGALGLDGHPISTNQVADVSDYLDVRKFYNRFQHDQVIATIDSALEKDPNSIFKSEFLLYKIRAKIALDDLSDAIDLCKDFLREFSGDEAIPEVLLHLGRLSTSMGLLIDAEYFYDRLLTEHYNTEEATKGLIALGHHTSSKGDSKKAIKYYNEALQKAETKELASEVALKTANFYLAKGDVKSASNYIQRIAVGNVKYLLEDYDRTFDIAKEFSDHEAYNEAADLMYELLKTLEKTDRRYEGGLYQIAVWYDLGNSNEKAYELYKRYLKQFHYGDYVSEIKERKDKVLFEIGDTNSTKLLALYEMISNKYSHQEIAKRAQYHKAELLFKTKGYQKVLDMKNTLKDLDLDVYPNARSIISKSAQALAKEELKVKHCQNALTLLRNYDFNLTQSYSDTLYKCTMDVNDFKEAKALAEPYIYDKNLSKRMLWLYRFVKSSAKTGDMKSVFVMSEDLLALAKIENVTKYQDVKRDLFLAAIALEKDDKAIVVIKDIEKSFGLRYEEIELYYAMVKLAKGKKDNTMLENYASKVLDLQNASKTDLYSPSVELMLINALKKLNKEKKAYKVAKALVKRVTRVEDIARANYELGMLCQRLNLMKEMKEAFVKSSEASKTSAWSKLSKDALDLL